MKSKSIVLVLLACFAGLTFAPAQGKGAVREARQTYRGVSDLRAGPFVLHPGPTRVVGDLVVGGVTFQARRDERFVEFKITDTSGQRIHAYVEAAPSGRKDGEAKAVGTVCGSTRKPLRFPPGSEIFVYLSPEGCGGSPAIPTEGVIEARFSG
ncbi:MAG: hypothetical protein M3285_02735 [Actinomycetota bacterium]|nr:hypothetical protein [Actinomycetota bacterium]